MPFPIPLAKIAETEAAMGVTFPAVFKARMSRENGGTVYLGGDEDDAWELHPFFDTTNRKTITRSANDIRRETEYLREAGIGFPLDGIAIARDGAGGRLFLRVAEGVVDRQVWVFRIPGGTIARVLDDVAELWERP